MFTEQAKSEFKIDFPANPNWFQTIRLCVLTACFECGFDNRTAGQVAIAIDEALTNIYRHGYESKLGGPIVFRMQTTITPKPSVNFVIQDEARQVKPEDIKPRSLDEIRPGGIGVHLIKTIMDNVEWTCNQSKGMTLKMAKTYTTLAKENN